MPATSLSDDAATITTGSMPRSRISRATVAAACGLCAPSGSVIHPRPEVLITGSLFLVGEARTLLLGAPTDPFVVTDPPAKP